MIKKIKKYILFILISIAISPLVKAMEVGDEDIQQESLTEILHPEIIAKIVDHVLHQSYLETSKGFNFNKALINIYLINHFMYEITHSNPLKKIIKKLIKNKKRSLELITAASNNQTDLITELFFDENVNINMQNQYGETALAVAVMNNCKEAVQLLLSLGADVNSPDQAGYSPLMLAVWENNQELANLLLTYHADLNMQNNQKDTALTIAAWHGFTEIVQLLLNAGANFKIRNSDNVPALAIASSRGFTDIVHLLMKIIDPKSKYKI